MEGHIHRRIVWPFAIAQTIVWAAFFYSFPALLLFWEADMVWSKKALSVAFTIALLTSAVFSPLAGRLIDRGLAPWSFPGCAVLGAAALLAMSQVTALWQFHLCWFVLGMAMSGCLYDPCFAVLTRCLGPMAKRAITLVTLVAGLAGTLSFPSAHTLAQSFGWRGTVVVLALAVLLVAVPLIWIATRAAEEMGPEHAAADRAEPFPARRFLASPIFLLLVVVFVSVSMGHGMILAHLLPIMADRGIGAQAAVLAASMIGPMQVAGRLAMMAAERHVPMMSIARGCFVATATAAGCLYWASGNPGLVAAFVILHGAGWGVTSIVRPVITADLLGSRHFGAISGLLSLPVLIGSAISATLAAIVWERGGYDLVIVMAMCASGIALAALIAAARLSSTKEQADRPL